MIHGIHFATTIVIPIADMIIGFAQRRQNISEADRPFPQDQIFQLFIDVRSLRISEININVTFETRRQQGDGRIAEVEELQVMDFLDHDALFGTLNVANDDLEDNRTLFSGMTVLQNRLNVLIVNDMGAEPVECFELLITSPDVEGDRDIYECFDDIDNSDSFFCLHEICIVDDDGLFISICLDILSKDMYFFPSRTIYC